MNYLFYALMKTIFLLKRVKYLLSIKHEKWEEGKPLKFLLTSYCGARNMGADIRVEEIVRQLQTIFSNTRIEISVTTINKSQTKGYFKGAGQLLVPSFFPFFISKACSMNHVVIACEGAMFKSKFADALTTYIASCLGIANAENKVGIGYGGEAGFMNKRLASFVKKSCRKSLIIARNTESKVILDPLKIKVKSGTDTAWTFRPANKQVGRQLLLDNGWDGNKKVLAICPINPFWWPVKPNLWKALVHSVAGKYLNEHYKSIYFHKYTDNDRRNYNRYIRLIAKALNRFVVDKEIFVVLIGMDQLDTYACNDLSRQLIFNPPQLASGEYNMYQMVSMLWNCDFLLSSHYHAIVTSMTGRVPSAGITMDERIRNIMRLREEEHLCLEATDRNLSYQCLNVLNYLFNNSQIVRDNISKTVPGELRNMGLMGKMLAEEIYSKYPKLKRNDNLKTWRDYLPPLSEEMKTNFDLKKNIQPEESIT